MRGTVSGDPSHFEELKTERLDLAQHAVQRGLIGQMTCQQRLSSAGLSRQGRERAHERVPEFAT